MKLEPLDGVELRDKRRPSVPVEGVPSVPVPVMKKQNSWSDKLKHAAVQIM